MDYGFIKMHRKMLDWEWYNDINTKVLFLHLLLKANWEDKQWKGITIERGEVLSSLEHLSKETGLSTQNIRTSITRLKSTGELTSKSTSKYTLFKLNNYDTYQGDQQANQQTANKQLTTTKELKEIKENNNIEELEKIIDFWNNTFSSNYKITDNLKEVYNKTRKNYTKEDITDGLMKYIKIAKEESYKQYRLVPFTFFKQANGFIKFFNS